MSSSRCYSNLNNHSYITKRRIDRQDVTNKSICPPKLVSSHINKGSVLKNIEESNLMKRKYQQDMRSTDTGNLQYKYFNSNSQPSTSVGYNYYSPKSQDQNYYQNETKRYSEYSKDNSLKPAFEFRQDSSIDPSFKNSNTRPIKNFLTENSRLVPNSYSWQERVKSLNNDNNLLKPFLKEQ